MAEVLRSCGQVLSWVCLAGRQKTLENMTSALWLWSCVWSILKYCRYLYCKIDQGLATILQNYSLSRLIVVTASDRNNTGSFTNRLEQQEL